MDGMDGMDDVDGVDGVDYGNEESGGVFEAGSVTYLSPWTVGLLAELDELLVLEDVQSFLCETRGVWLTGLLRSPWQFLGRNC